MIFSGGIPAPQNRQLAVPFRYSDAAMDITSAQTARGITVTDITSNIGVKLQSDCFPGVDGPVLLPW
jgi:hypothetical protein